MTDAPAPARGLVPTLRSFVLNVFVHPVRDGRLRDIDWPVGLRPIVAMALGAYGIAVVVVLTGGILRATTTLFAQSTGQVPQPRSTVWLLFALVALSLALAQTGAIHTPRWLRWTITGFVAGSLLYVASGQLFAASGWFSIGTAVVAAISLIVLVAVRGSRRFSWVEFVIVAGIIFLSLSSSLTVSAEQAERGFDFAPLLLTSTMALLSSLAVPATIASGASVAELAVNSATWVAIALRTGLGRIAVIVLVVILVAWRIWDLIPQVGAVIADPAYEVVSLLGAAGLLAVLAAAWWGLRRLRPDRAPATIGGLVEKQQSVSLPVATAITPMVIITPIIILAGMLSAIAPAIAPAIWGAYGVLASQQVIGGMRLATGIVLIVMAIVLARRGVASAPEILVAIGISSAVLGGIVVFGGYQPWTASSVSHVASVVCLGLLVWMLARRRITTKRMTALAVALLAAGLIANPQWLTDPLGALLGSGAVAAVLVGFTWALLTGYAVANGDSGRFPRPARVLLMLANTVFATTVLAYVALSRDPGSSFDFDGLVLLGQITFGIPLVAGALIVAFAAVLRDREVDDNAAPLP